MKLRAIKLSKTFNDQLVQQIELGEQCFGTRVAEEKKGAVLATIENLLADNPAIKRPHEALGLVVYPISETPFFILLRIIMSMNYACISSSGQAPALMISARPQPSGERHGASTNTDIA